MADGTLIASTFLNELGLSETMQSRVAQSFRPTIRFFLRTRKIEEMQEAAVPAAGHQGRAQDHYF